MISRIRAAHPRRAVGALAIAAALLLVPTSAEAAVTVGSDFSPTPNSLIGCGTTSTCTIAQTTLSGAQLTAPFDGVIVRWRMLQQFTGNWGPVRLRVLRQQSGMTFTAMRSSDPENPPNVASAPVTHEFSSRLPISAGDHIAIDLLDNCCLSGLTTAASGVFWGPLLRDGATAAGTSFSGVEFSFNADVEPDADCDGFGDETQDPSVTPPGSCPQPAPPPEPLAKADGTLTLDANKGKVEKGRKVTLSGQYDVASNESCEANRAIELQRRLKSQPDTAFSTFETVQTDAAGNFSTKEKVKKTYFYRAVVRETEACDGETSNSQKVRVQKKKAAQEA